MGVAELLVAIGADIAALEAGMKAEQLARKPLWLKADPPEKFGVAKAPTPAWVRSHWRKLKRELLAAGDDWNVWTEWYDAVLRGRLPYGKLSRSGHGDLELKIALLPDAVWKRGPKVVNKKIRDLIEAARAKDGIVREAKDTSPDAPPPKVPAAKPAAVEPIIKPNGRIGLPASPAETDLDEEGLAAALDAVKLGFGELADDAESAGNIDKRFIAELRRLAERVPASVPTQFELFRLGHVEDLLNDYGTTVNEEWPTVLAKRYHALNRQFDRTLRQVPKWRAFKRNANKDRYSEDEVSAVFAVAEALVVELKGEDARRFVEADLAKAIARLAAPIAGKGDRPAKSEELFAYLEAGNEALAADVLESASNVAKKLSEIAVGTEPYVAPYGRGVKKFLKGHADGFEKGMEEAGPKSGAKSAAALRKWSKRALLGASGAVVAPWVATLLHKFPEAAQWLQPVIDFLKSKGG